MHLFLLAFFLPSALAQKWCGKVYKAGQAVVPPGGQFPLPPPITIPQLALRCNPALIPFLPDDITDPSSSLILVDALVRDTKIAGAQSLIMPSSPDAELLVSVSLDGSPLTSGTVPLNGSAALPFSLSKVSPRLEPHVLTCTGTLSSPPQTFMSVPTNLTYLPEPPSSIGSVTKLDLRTGGLLAKRAQTQGPYEPVFPVGFYTNFGGYLEGNDTVLEIHPIPPFDNLTTFNHMVDKMEELGLWLMYDMRWDYMNATAVTEQVTSLRDRTNLLLYYTADEPDGSEDPLSAPASSAALINSLDPYRPSSLVLNCQDYFFTDYAAGTPVLLQDTYPIGINATFSVIWKTPCTSIRGDCGCDNCVGDFEDIRGRMDDFATRMEVLGWERSKTVWTVPQGFGSSEYWSRTPTGAEFLVQMIVAINAGARGSMSWNDPTTPSIKAAASAFALALPELTPFFLSSPLSQPSVTFAHVITPGRLDIGVWACADGKVLVMGSNLNYFAASVTLDEVFSIANLAVNGNPRMVLDGGARIVGSEIHFDSVQAGAWIFD
ncbi:hypothetical protein B0F90DRAFT_1811231 [Multifurca ochricompacta]|uniref:Glycoside hydrolase subgroup catalytic core protein n=1 Tax=Multifurca ochricompacta TaxID=376703 RepID=A0AAD4QKG3_9AGAM|nr:hypothetical protein B0F90DRAFT_1811231 [Multifurca ochricompacta]